MADETDDEEQTLDLTEELEPEEPEGDEPEGDEEQPAEDGEAEEETVITFSDDGEGEDDSSVVRKLRERNRELNRELSELRRTSQKPRIEVGEKPTLASCGYDEEVFEAELDQWNRRKAEAEAEETAAAERERVVQEAWQQDLQSYETKKARLGVADFSDAEEAVKTTLSHVQRAVIVKAASDPAAFTYALGKSEARLAEVAKIEDPVKLAAAVARMEGALKVVRRRKGPAIDAPERGSGRMPGANEMQKTLEQLEKKAERTNDRTELIAFKKKHGL